MLAGPKVTCVEEQNRYSLLIKRRHSVGLKMDPGQVVNTTTSRILESWTVHETIMAQGLSSLHRLKAAFALYDIGTDTTRYNAVGTGLLSVQHNTVP